MKHLFKFFLIVILIFAFPSCDIDSDDATGRPPGSSGQNIPGGSGTGGSGTDGTAGSGSSTGGTGGGGGEAGSAGTGTGSGGIGTEGGAGSAGVGSGTGTGSGGVGGGGAGGGGDTGIGGGSGQNPPGAAEFPFLSLTGTRNEMHRMSLTAQELNRTVSLTSPAVAFGAYNDYGMWTHGTFWGTLHNVPIWYFFDDSRQAFSAVTVATHYCYDEEIRCGCCNTLVYPYIIHHQPNNYSHTLPLFGLIPRQPAETPHHRVPRSFSSDTLVLPRGSNFTSNHTERASYNFSFRLASPDHTFQGGRFPVVSFHNLIFSHSITANFRAVSRGFYEYRRIVITYPMDITISNIRPTPIVRDFVLNPDDNSITINLRPYYTPHIGNVISFNLRARNGSQTTRTIVIE